MTAIKPDRTEWLRAHHHGLRKEASVRAGVKAELLVEPKQVKPRPSKTRARPKPAEPISEVSVLDQIPLASVRDGRAAPSPYTAIRRVIAWLYEVEMDRVGLNFRINPIHPALSSELTYATGWTFQIWVGMTVEQLWRLGVLQ